ncbi:hypothetical protein H4582DRAFT_2052259 [Lactarius indigo]|nr:hypothetical protein H4582DRAFT_2052259 [Lactarius indigo]
MAEEVSSGITARRSGHQYYTRVTTIGATSCDQMSYLAQALSEITPECGPPSPAAYTSETAQGHLFYGDLIDPSLPHDVSRPIVGHSLCSLRPPLVFNVAQQISTPLEENAFLQANDAKSKIKYHDRSLPGVIDQLSPAGRRQCCRDLDPARPPIWTQANMGGCLSEDKAMPKSLRMESMRELVAVLPSRSLMIHPPEMRSKRRGHPVIIIQVLLFRCAKTVFTPLTGEDSGTYHFCDFVAEKQAKARSGGSVVRFQKNFPDERRTWTSKGFLAADTYDASSWQGPLENFLLRLERVHAVDAVIDTISNYQRQECSYTVAVDPRALAREIWRLVTPVPRHCILVGGVRGEGVHSAHSSSGVDARVTPTPAFVGSARKLWPAQAEGTPFTATSSSSPSRGFMNIVVVIVGVVGQEFTCCGWLASAGGCATEVGEARASICGLADIPCNFPLSLGPTYSNEVCDWIVRACTIVRLCTANFQLISVAVPRSDMGIRGTYHSSLRTQLLRIPTYITMAQHHGGDHVADSKWKSSIRLWAKLPCTAPARMHPSTCNGSVPGNSPALGLVQIVALGNEAQLPRTHKIRPNLVLCPLFKLHERRRL